MTDSVQGPERLAPCPFCGGEALIEHGDDEAGDEVSVVCQGICGARIGGVYSNNPCADEDTLSVDVMLTGAWNRRVLLPDSGDAPRAHAPDCSAVVFAPGAKGQGWEPACDCGATSAPDGLLPDTFIERAVQVALAQAEPNDDTAVMLSAFEASFIRRRAALGSAPRGGTL